MKEYRCRKCNRLLFRSNAERGMVQSVCPRKGCRTMQLVPLGTDPVVGFRPAPGTSEDDEVLMLEAILDR